MRWSPCRIRRSTQAGLATALGNHTQAVIVPTLRGTLRRCAVICVRSVHGLRSGALVHQPQALCVADLCSCDGQVSGPTTAQCDSRTMLGAEQLVRPVDSVTVMSAAAG